MCHMSHVTCNFFFFFLLQNIDYNYLLLFYKLVKPVGGGSVTNGAYPVWFYLYEADKKKYFFVISTFSSHSNKLCVWTLILLLR